MTTAEERDAIEWEEARATRQVWAVVESDGFYLIRSAGRVDETVGGPYTTPGDLMEDADDEGWEIANADEVAEWMRPDPLAGLIED